VKVRSSSVVPQPPLGQPAANWHLMHSCVVVVAVPVEMRVHEKQFLLLFDVKGEETKIMTMRMNWKKIQCSCTGDFAVSRDG
jgi:hypothetical protein